MNFLWQCIEEKNMSDPIVCAAVIFNEKGEILLQLRDEHSYLRSPGYWTLPGGHQEKGETLTECLTREIYEETNLDVHKSIYFLTLVDIFEDKPFPTIHFFLKSIFPPYDVICNEGQELKFWKVDEISNLKINKYLTMVIQYSILFKSNWEHFMSKL